ncbi:hypothetical protein RB623_08455 [Mesorhizobium sp. LHD-90]|uniref:hypothetical protein n=1 Tax=Mesorhizobium sp. LHD-90 TaxID=3071414 RepID=UPI0027E11536|nr:hypothetical protein [Mesorhizobium sp. LHD-90]MDQ6434077.1 hypothetical protein [Mesorhizobium sp. LHD-90]
MRFATGLLALALLGASSVLALAQDFEPVSVPFEGGTITITENDELEKIVAFDGKELARNYVAFFDRTVDLGDTKVALLSVGDGGNQCGAATLIVWKPKDADIRSQMVGEDCGSPPAAVTESSIYFVPYLVPGASAPVETWSPETGLKVSGLLQFSPQPGTTWDEIDASKFDNLVEAFGNEALYADAKKLLGDDLTGFATGLLTGGGTEQLPGGLFYASGCVPHACGLQDSFMAVDKKGRKLYFAQQADSGEPRTWPALAEWPGEVAKAMQGAIGGQQ